MRVAYDANLRLRLWSLARARATIIATMALSDVFLVSIDEAQSLCNLNDPERIVAWCHEQGAKLVALKLGKDGAIGSDGIRRDRLAGHRVEAVDATGAGDCFAGALIARLCAGDDFWAALRYANAAAALTTTGYGAVAPLPRPEEVLRLLKAGFVIGDFVTRDSCWSLRNTFYTSHESRITSHGLKSPHSVVALPGKRLRCPRRLHSAGPSPRGFDLHCER